MSNLHGEYMKLKRASVYLYERFKNELTDDDMESLMMIINDGGR